MGTPGGQIPIFWPKMTPNIGITKDIPHLVHLIMQNHHKYTFRTKHDDNSSKWSAKQWGVTLYMGTPGGQIPTYWPKMAPNIGIIQITSLYGPFDNVI